MDMINGMGWLAYGLRSLMGMDGVFPIIINSEIQVEYAC